LLPIQQVDVVQWVAYYPGVLYLPDARLAPTETTALADSIRGWNEGDLLAALQHYPANRTPASDAERIYRASLLLAVGEVDSAQALLQGQIQDTSKQRLSDSLQRLVAVVKGRAGTNNPAPGSATEWLVESYTCQAQRNLPGALAAAREAV